MELTGFHGDANSMGEGLTVSQELSAHVLPAGLLWSSGPGPG